jgi:hypothetical protein
MDWFLAPLELLRKAKTSVEGKKPVGFSYVLICP